MIFFARLEGVFWLVGYYSVFSRGILVSLKAISLSIFFDFFDKKRQIFKFTLLEWVFWKQRQSLNLPHII